MAKSSNITEVVIRDCTFNVYFSILEGLFVNVNLTRLTLQSMEWLEWDDEDVETLIQSLPAIENLYLNTSPLVEPDDPTTGPFTFNHLLAFYEFCPHLRELGITVDTSTEYDSIPSTFNPHRFSKSSTLGGLLSMKNIWKTRQHSFHTSYTTTAKFVFKIPFRTHGHLWLIFSKLYEALIDDPGTKICINLPLLLPGLETPASAVSIALSFYTSRILRQFF
ncbi:hypothetical protein H0H87_006366 [Tephrocybe sp. NHM501043]|nr:hypothetical protein H0H87_006366 [Tephrocybe sp. NHM501043]